MKPVAPLLPRGIAALAVAVLALPAACATLTEPAGPPHRTLLAVGGLGSLGTCALEDAAFDIADIDHAARAALKSGGRTRLFSMDLARGRATRIGTVGDGRGMWGLAIEP